VRYRFGAYVLTEDRLTSGGRTVPLATKPLGVLRELLARPGELVEKQELMRAVWGDLPVSDESLARSVFLLRQALGDNDCAELRYVETVYGRGYRFVADVSHEQPRTGAPRRTASTVEPRQRAAQELCLTARFVLSRGTRRVPEAIALFEQAVSADPTYAPALIGLGEANLALAAGGTVRPRVPVARARVLLEDAVQLAPDDARAHACLGMLYGDFDWDVARAERRLALALARDPADPLVRWIHGRHLLSLGRYAAALDELDASASLDPTNAQLLIHRALYTLHARRRELALERAREIFRVEPAHPTARMALALALGANARGVEALEVLRPLLDELDAHPHLRPSAGYALACAGDAAGARAQLEALERSAGDGLFVPPTVTGALAAQLGERAGALRWLDTAVQELCPLLPFAATYPAFEPLHDEPRFRTIVRRTGRESALPARKVSA
jgi:DNA-binding winged helix-turn-helix (wHTH) protein/cytochrome c-type biogenesis protein CcmH/NrfG